MLINQLNLVGKEKIPLKGSSGEKSKDDVMGTTDITFPFTNKNWDTFGPHELKAEIKGGVFDNKRILRGRTGRAEQAGYELLIKFQDDGYQLKKPYSGDDYNDEWIEDVLKKIVGETEDLKLKLRDIKHEKISRSEVHSSGTATGGCVTGTAYPQSQCGQGAAYKVHTYSWQDKCSRCNKTGVLTKNLKGTPAAGCDTSGLTCDLSKGGCDVDYDAVTGFSTECADGRPNAASCTPGCGYQLVACTGGSVTPTSAEEVASTDTVSEDSTDVEATETAVEESGSIEEELQAICAYKDYHMVVTQNQEVYIQSRFRPNKPDFVVKPWMMKKNSFHYAFEPDPELEDIPTTAIVTYANGTVKVSIPELVKQRGEGTPLRDKQSKMNKSEAVKHAWSLLFGVLREQTLEISFEMLLTGSFSVGHWIEVENPKTGSSDIYWVDNISMNLDPASIHTMTVNGLYMPKKQETKSGGGNLASLDAIGREEAKFGDCQEGTNPGSSSSAYMEKNGCGNCWADSEWLYNKLSAAGIQCRVMGNHGGSYPRHAWIEINTGGGWVTYPYSTYGSKHTGVPSGVGEVFVLIGPGKGQINIISILSSMGY